MVGKFINMRQYYNTYSQIGVFISHKDMNQYWDSKGLNLTHQNFLKETGTKVITYQVIKLKNIK